jgi:hypothetical protein
VLERLEVLTPYDRLFLEHILEAFSAVQTTETDRIYARGLIKWCQQLRTQRSGHQCQIGWKEMKAALDNGMEVG